MKKILIIEDNDDVRSNIEEILELANYDVLAADNGKTGVELVRNYSPDLVICDIMMPGLDGFGVLRILNQYPETVGIPFIFLTAKADKSDIRKGMNLGADDYITKPFEEDDLLEAIETRLRKNKIVHQEFSRSVEGLNHFIDEARGVEKLDELSQDRKLKSYQKKEVIYSEGDYANYLYFITKGKVKCVKIDEYGKEFVIDILGDGNFIGYMTLLEDGDYHETAIAMEPTEVAIIPKQDFKTLIQKNRDVATRFIKMLSGNVQEKEKRLLQLAYTPVRERVADTLLKLTSDNGDDIISKWIRISREDMANIVGTAKESLIRVLSEFKKDGLIESEGSQLRILDKKGLSRIVTSF